MGFLAMVLSLIPSQKPIWRIQAYSEGPSPQIMLLSDTRQTAAHSVVRGPSWEQPVFLLSHITHRLLKMALLRKFR